MRSQLRLPVLAIVAILVIAACQSGATPTTAPSASAPASVAPSGSAAASGAPSGGDPGTGRR